MVVAFGLNPSQVWDRFSILVFRLRTLAAKPDFLYQAVQTLRTLLGAPFKLDVSQVTMDETIQKAKG